MKLREEIVSTRMKLGMTQVEFAEKLEVSQSSISQWENGTDIPTTALLFRMADLTGNKRLITREALTSKREPIEHCPCCGRKMKPERQKKVSK
jgi:transcriptional regulator with XRE-family HTH domain